MKLPVSIKTKITLWYLLAVGFLVLLFGLIAYFLLADGLSRNIIDPWDIKEAGIQVVPDGNGRITEFTDISDTMTNPGYNIMSISGTEILETASEDGMIKILTPGGYSLFMERDMLTGNGTVSVDEMVVYIYSSKHDPSDLRLIVTTRSEENTESILGLFKRTIILTGGITLFAAGLIGFIIVWRHIRPLNTIIERLKKSSGEGQTRRFEVTRTDEVGELAEALNRLFDQTEKHIIDERQVTSDISHELRTPLAIVQAEASLALTRDRDSDEYRKIIENISREIFHLSSLVDKLLFLARPDKNYDLETNTFNLQELIEEIVSNAHVMCELKDQNFNYIADNSIDNCTITADFMRLRELFLNLIDNAVSYTAPGGDITFTVKRENGEVRISVLDSGIGIEEKHFPFLFDRFYRVNNSQKQNKAGTGLGLAICRRIVQLHGGKISVQSKPGEGSTFTVILPL